MRFRMLRVLLTGLAVGCGDRISPTDLTEASESGAALMTEGCPTCRAMSPYERSRIDAGIQAMSGAGGQECMDAVNFIMHVSMQRNGFGVNTALGGAMVAEHVAAHETEEYHINFNDDPSYYDGEFTDPDYVAGVLFHEAGHHFGYDEHGATQFAARCMA